MRAPSEREQRMIDLKREMNELCEEIGKPPAYDRLFFRRIDLGAHGRIERVDLNAREGPELGEGPECKPGG